MSEKMVYNNKGEGEEETSLIERDLKEKFNEQFGNIAKLTS